jgi:acyl carrier protein
MDDVRQFVIQLIKEKGALPSGVETDTINYIDSGLIDSIGIIKFVLQIEARFDVEFSESDIESETFRTIGGLVSMIQKKYKQKSQT